MDRDILSEIAASTAQTIGAAFLSALVRSMRDAMDAKVAIITTGIGTPPRRARSVAAWRRDSVSDEAIEYDLEGTPCEMVYAGDTVIVSKQLVQKFPKEAGFESYVGVPLRGLDGKPCGHFAVLSERPLEDPERAVAILRIFALRAEAELQRETQERERTALIDSLSRANRRISRRHSELRKSNELKTLMLGMVAHDLRNPLATMLNRGELISELTKSFDLPPAQADKIRESCEVIIATAERMDRSIAGLLNQAKANATEVILDLHDCNVRQVAHVAIGLNSAAATRKSISIIEDVDAGLVVTADEDRLAECLDNLIHNAIKYSEPGGRVTVAAREQNGMIQVSVEDRGQGLSEEDIARAFRPFQRLSAVPTAGESSTGLGLSIVKSIVEAHVGTVGVESAGRGQGARFTVCLPRTSDGSTIGSSLRSQNREST
jgi:signal transduction histidine kinase